MSSRNNSCARGERPTKHTFGELPRHFDGGYLRGRRPGARKRGKVRIDEVQKKIKKKGRSLV